MAQHFGVPLHAEHSGRGVELDRFDVTVVIVGYRSNADPSRSIT